VWILVTGRPSLRYRSFCSRRRVGVSVATDTVKPHPGVPPDMRDEAAIRERIAELEAEYDDHDPPSSALEDEAEVAILRAIEELEWVLEEHDEEGGFTT
jgi:hypothetical protein